MDLQPSTGKQWLFTTRIIHGALVTSVVIFNLVVCYLVSHQKPVTQFEQQHLIFYVMVGFIALFSIVGNQFVFSQQLEKVKQEGTLHKKLSGYQTANIIRYAMLEGSALLSTVVTLITLSVWFFAITLIMLLLLISLFPTFEKTIEHLELSYTEQEQLINPNSLISD